MVEAVVGVIKKTAMMTTGMERAINIGIGIVNVMIGDILNLRGSISYNCCEGVIAEGKQGISLSNSHKNPFSICLLHLVSVVHKSFFSDTDMAENFSSLNGDPFDLSMSLKNEILAFLVDLLLLTFPVEAACNMMDGIGERGLSIDGVQCNERRTDDAPSADMATSNLASVGKRSSEAGPTHVLVVRGLNENADEEMLCCEFVRHTLIKDIRLVRDRFTHVSRGLAFVHFHSVEDATKALDATNGKTLEKNGQIIRVTFAKSVHGPGAGAPQSSSLAAAALRQQHLLNRTGNRN